VRPAPNVSPLTTTVYTQPSDQEMWERVRGVAVVADADILTDKDRRAGSA
jgi:hypothetical protein